MDLIDPRQPRYTSVSHVELPERENDFPSLCSFVHCENYEIHTPHPFEQLCPAGPFMDYSFGGKTAGHHHTAFFCRYRAQLIYTSYLFEVYHKDER